MTETDNVRAAEALLASYEHVANVETWQGDKAPYMTRLLAEAQVYALLAIAEAITRHAEL